MKTFFCVAIAFLCGLGLSSAQAQVVTPNPAPTIITTAPYTITKPGYYQLGKDLVVSNTTGWIIKVDASNVTLDFGGHYISGPSNSPATQLLGVYAEERGNITVQNGTIAYCNFGVYFHGNGAAASPNINQRVQNMLVTYCYSYGIDFVGTSGCDVLDCRISYIGGSNQFDGAVGISLESTSDGRASGNKIGHITPRISPAQGYGIAASQDSFITGNFVSHVGTSIFRGVCQQNLTSNCTYALSPTTDAGLNK